MPTKPAKMPESFRFDDSPVRSARAVGPRFAYGRLLLALISGGVLSAFGLAPETAEAQGQSTICTQTIGPSNTNPSIVFNPTTGLDIGAAGVYCLVGNINTGAAFTGAANSAIRINVSSVVLDFNGFRLNSAAGINMQAAGVTVNNQRNVVIRNGSIRSFFKGIVLNNTGGTGPISQGNVVEGMRIERVYSTGIELVGNGIIARDNVVVAIGYGTAFANLDAVGIRSDGTGARLLNNDVNDVFGTGTGLARSILMLNANGSVVENNRMGNINVVSGATGVRVESGDVQVVGNRLTTMDRGVHYSGGTGSYRDNLFSSPSCTAPYEGGTNVPNTNYPLSGC